MTPEPKIERRHHWELDEPMPEGFRFLRDEWSDEKQDMARLVTSAPEGSPAYQGEFRWLPMHQVIEERTVTEWREVRAHDS